MLVGAACGLQPLPAHGRPARLYVHSSCATRLHGGGIQLCLGARCAWLLLLAAGLCFCNSTMEYGRIPPDPSLPPGQVPGARGVGGTRRGTLPLFKAWPVQLAVRHVRRLQQEGPLPTLTGSSPTSRHPLQARRW